MSARLATRAAQERSGKWQFSCILAYVRSYIILSVIVTNPENNYTRSLPNLHSRPCTCVLARRGPRQCRGLQEDCGTTSSRLGQVLFSQVGRKTFRGVTVKVGTKKRMTQLESQFIDECFDIQKPQNDGVEAGQENVATSSPNTRPASPWFQREGGSDAFHWLR